MGNVQMIMKSRKEHTCGGCRKKIPVGSPYYKGQLRFMPPIIRCESCGLKWYEVTTSEYIRDAGAIVEDWQESFTVEDGVWEEIASNLEEIMNSCSERLENMPEHLQEDSESGQLLNERIEALESVIDQLNSCTMSEFLEAGVEALSEEEKDALAKAGDISDLESWYKKFWDGKSELAQNWQEATEEEIINNIDNILEEVVL